MVSYIVLKRSVLFATIQCTLISSIQTWTWEQYTTFSTLAVLAGDNFNCTCTISTARNYSDYIQARWIRKDCNGNRDVLTTDGKVDGKFKTDKRYGASVKALNKHNTSRAFSLSIKNIKLTETGSYGCEFALDGDGSSLTRFTKITAAQYSPKLKVVLQTVSSFNRSVKNLTDGQNVTLDIGEEQKFNCLVIGRALVDIYIHGKNEDVSIKNSFRQEYLTDAKCKQTSEGVLFTELYTDTYKEGVVTMEDRWDRKQLMCVAKRFLKNSGGKVLHNSIAKSSITLLMKRPTGATDTVFKPIWTFYMCVLIVQLLPLI